MRHLPVDSTNGSRDLRLVSRLRTEITAALPGKQKKIGKMNLLLRLFHFEPAVQGHANKISDHLWSRTWKRQTHKRCQPPEIGCPIKVESPKAKTLWTYSPMKVQCSRQEVLGSKTQENLLPDLTSQWKTADGIWELKPIDPMVCPIKHLAFKTVWNSNTKVAFPQRATHWKYSPTKNDSRMSQWLLILPELHVQPATMPACP